jgi:single-strand DNA-binding protein
MPTYNHWVGVGRLTRDVEVRYTPKGHAATSGCVACSRKWKGEDGQEREEVLFLNFTVWGKPGEYLAENGGVKGAAVFLAGRLVTESWEKDGKTINAIKLVVEGLPIVVSQPKSKAQAPTPQTSPEPTAKPATKPAEPVPDGDDGDLPF